MAMHPLSSRGLLGRKRQSDKELLLPGISRVIETSGSWESGEDEASASESTGIAGEKVTNEMHPTRVRWGKQHLF